MRDGSKVVDFCAGDRDEFYFLDGMNQWELEAKLEQQEFRRDDAITTIEAIKRRLHCMRRKKR